jgi:hypothetical protein
MNQAEYNWDQDRERGLPNLIRRAGLRSDIRDPISAGDLLAQMFRLERTRAVLCTHLNSAPVRPWLWTSVSETPELRAGLITIYRGQPIPPHDHPGASGLLLVLRGCLRVSTYALARQQGNAVATRLDRVSSRTLAVGETSGFGACETNIHALESLSPSSSAIDFIWPSYDERERCWYLRVWGADHTHETLVAVPVCLRRAELRAANSGNRRP